MTRGNYMKFRFRGPQLALGEHGRVHSFACCPWLLLRYNGRATTETAEPQRLKYLLSDLIRESAGSYVRALAKLGRAAIPPLPKLKFHFNELSKHFTV